MAMTGIGRSTLPGRKRWMFKSLWMSMGSRNCLLLLGKVTMGRSRVLQRGVLGAVTNTTAVAGHSSPSLFPYPHAARLACSPWVFPTSPGAGVGSGIQLPQLLLSQAETAPTQPNLGGTWLPPAPRTIGIAGTLTTAGEGKRNRRGRGREVRGGEVPLRVKGKGEEEFLHFGTYIFPATAPAT